MISLNNFGFDCRSDVQLCIQLKSTFGSGPYRMWKNWILCRFLCLHLCNKFGSVSDVSKTNLILCQCKCQCGLVCNALNTFFSKGHKDDPEGQRSFPKEVAVSGRQSSPSRMARDVVSISLNVNDDVSPVWLNPVCLCRRRRRRRVTCGWWTHTPASPSSTETLRSCIQSPVSVNGSALNINPDSAVQHKRHLLATERSYTLFSWFSHVKNRVWKYIPYFYFHTIP